MFFITRASDMSIPTSKRTIWYNRFIYKEREVYVLIECCSSIRGYCVLASILITNCDFALIFLTLWFCSLIFTSQCEPQLHFNLGAKTPKKPYLYFPFSPPCNHPPLTGFSSLLRATTHPPVGVAASEDEILLRW